MPACAAISMIASRPKAIVANGNGRGGVEKAVPRSKMPFGSAATKPTAHFASGLVGLY